MKRLLLCLLMFSCLTLWAEEMNDAFKKAYDLSQKSQYNEAAQVLIDFMQSNPGSDYQMEINYSVACYYSLAKKKDLAFRYLKTAIDQGFVDKAWIEKDTDLDSIHKDKRWKQDLALIEKNVQGKIATLPDKHTFLQEITLPEPKTKSDVSVEQALYQRRSVREYSEEALTMSDVSQILWSAYGVTKVVEPELLRGGLKTAPSAGALYPLEIYLAAWNVTDLEPGFYLYQPAGHKLQLIKKGNFSRELTEAALGQECILNAPASLIYSAVFERTTSKYGTRGRERYVCMDLGHSGENVYLQAETLNMGTVALGAFTDLKLRLVVPMTKEEEPLYIMPFGKKKPASEDTSE